MTVDVFSAILSYATIPLYVAGLLVLVYIIAHTQLGFSLSRQIKQTTRTELAEMRPKVSIGTVFAVVLFTLFIVLLIASQRRYAHES